MQGQTTAQRVRATLARRHRFERLFSLLGIAAVALSLLALATLFFDVVVRARTAFVQTYVTLDVTLDPAILALEGAPTPEALRQSDTQAVLRGALRERFPDVTSQGDRRRLYELISSVAPHLLSEQLEQNPALVGQKLRLPVLANDDVDMYVKGHVGRDVPEDLRKLNDRQLGWIDQLDRKSTRLNSSHTDISRMPSSA